MADVHGNIGWDDKIREYVAGILVEAEADAASLHEMIVKLYPNPDHNAADRARRSAAAARRDLANLRLALQALSRVETGKPGPYTDPAVSARERASQTAARGKDDALTSEGAET